MEKRKYESHVGSIASLDWCVQRTENEGYELHSWHPYIGPAPHFEHMFAALFKLKESTPPLESH
jgi:hypothetical protein